MRQILNGEKKVQIIIQYFTLGSEEEGSSIAGGASI